MSTEPYKPQLSDEEAQKLWDENKRWGGDTLFKKLGNALCDIHTCTACEKCGWSVRPSYAVHGMCHDCAKQEIDRLRMNEVKS